MINIADIILEFGALYKAKGQNVKDIRRKIMVMNQTDKLFARQLTDDTVLDGGSVSMSPVLQAFQKTFTSYGDTTFKGRRIPLFQLKIDWEENPSDIEKSWLGFLAGDGISRKDWPLISYIINKLILDKAAEDYELMGVFYGKESPIVQGIPKPISGAMNGIKSLINTHISAGDTVAIGLGTVPLVPVDFVEYMEAFADQIPEEVQPFMQQIALSQTLMKRFRKGMRKKYGDNVWAQPDSIDTIIDTNLKVEGFRSHEGSNKIWTTIKGNAQLGLKKIANEQVFKVEESKRQVSIYTDFWKGIGFWQPEYIFTNDVDLT
jgi:hypothetical protein